MEKKEMYKLKAKVIDLPSDIGNIDLAKIAKETFDVLEEEQIIYSWVDNRYVLHDEAIQYFNEITWRKKMFTMFKISIALEKIKAEVIEARPNLWIASQGLALMNFN